MLKKLLEVVKMLSRISLNTLLALIALAAILPGAYAVHVVSQLAS